MRAEPARPVPLRRPAAAVKAPAARVARRAPPCDRGALKKAAEEAAEAEAFEREEKEIADARELEEATERRTHEEHQDGPVRPELGPGHSRASPSRAR